MSETSLSEMDTNPAVTETVTENTQNSGVAETEVESTESTEAQVDDEGLDSSEDSEAESEKPKKTGFEKRISKEVARKKEAQAEANYWKRVALERQGETQVTPQAVQAADKPKFADYNDIETYTEALTDWKLEQKLVEKEQKSQADTVTKNYNDRVKEFSKVRPDFQEVLADSDIVVSDYVKQLIFESDVGPALALYLAENEDEAARINGMSLVRQVAEVGKLEDRLVTKKVDKKVFSKAPAPVSPIKGGAPVTAKSLDDPSVSPDEWIKMRNKQTRYR